MKRIAGIASMMILGLTMNAQSYMSQYTTNYFILNPAYAGFDTNGVAQLWSRSSSIQLQNFHIDALTFGFSQRIAQGNSALGATIIYNNDYRFSQTANLNANYSFNLDLDESTDLIMGLGIGIIRRSDSLNDQQFRGTQISWHGTLSFGLLLKAGDWVFGVSGLNINQPTTKNLPRNVTMNRIIYGLIRLDQRVDEYVRIIPSLLLRSLDAQNTISLEGNFEVVLADLFRAGLGYRISRLGQQPYTINGITYNQTINYIFPSVGIKAGDDFFFQLAYDIPINKVGTVSYSYLEAGLLFSF